MNKDELIKQVETLLLDAKSCAIASGNGKSSHSDKWRDQLIKSSEASVNVARALMELIKLK